MSKNGVVSKNGVGSYSREEYEPTPFFPIFPPFFHTIFPEPTPFFPFFTEDQPPITKHKLTPKCSGSHFPGTTDAAGPARRLARCRWQCQGSGKSSSPRPAG